MPKIKISSIKQLCLFKFSYYFLVWHFTTSKSWLKVEKIQERCLRLQLNNCINGYETLLTKSGNHPVDINRLCILATEIFKALMAETYSLWERYFMTLHF